MALEIKTRYRLTFDKEINFHKVNWLGGREGVIHDGERLNLSLDSYGPGGLKSLPFFADDING